MGNTDINMIGIEIQKIKKIAQQLILLNMQFQNMFAEKYYETKLTISLKIITVT